MAHHEKPGGKHTDDQIAKSGNAPGQGLKDATGGAACATPTRTKHPRNRLFRGHKRGGGNNAR